MEKKEELENSSLNTEKTPIEALLSYVSFFLRYKYLIIVITLLSAAGSVIFAFISLHLPAEASPLPNRYHAYAVLIMDQDSINSRNSMMSLVGINSPLIDNTVNRGDLAIRVLHSRPFLDEVIQKFNIVNKYKIEKNIHSNARELVEIHSNFELDRRTGTLTIGYEDTDPVFAKNIVDFMVVNLQRWFNQWEKRTTLRKLEMMQEKINTVTLIVQELEKQIQQFQSKYGVLSVEQLAETQTEMIMELQSLLVQKEVQLSNYSGFANIEDQSFIQLKAERDSIKDLIGKIERGETDDGPSMPARAELPTLALEYAHLQMDHEIQLRIYQNLVEQYEVEKLTQTDASLFSILEPAEIPDEKSGPSRGRLCVIVTFLGFFFGVLIALFIEVNRNILRDPKKMQIVHGKQ